MPFAIEGKDLGTEGDGCRDAEDEAAAGGAVGCTEAGIAKRGRGAEVGGG